LDLDLLVAQVHWLYPGAFRDGQIPGPLFWLLSRRMQAVLALARVQMTDSVAKGAGLIMSGEKMLKHLQDDRDEAFPDG
jgi:hypothetical protein